MDHLATSSLFWILYILLFFPLLIFTCAGYWRMFQKAGKPGWGILIPFYNIYCIFDMAWGNGCMALLMLIPLVNIAIGIVTGMKLAAAFGKNGWFGLGLLFIPCIFGPILGWGSAIYLKSNE